MATHGTSDSRVADAHGSLAVGLLCGFTASLIWGGQISVSAFGVRSNLQVFDITAIRVAVAGLVLLPILLRSQPATLCGIGWRRGLILAVCAGPTYSLLSVGGLNFAPVTHNAIIISGLTPLLAALVAMLLFHFRPRPQGVIGLALIILGVMLIGWQGLNAGGAAQTWIGDLIFVGGAVLMAGYTVTAQRWVINPLRGTAVIGVLSLLYLPVYLTLIESHIPDAEAWEILLQAVYQGILAAAVSIYCYTRAVAILGAAYAALFIALVPVLATLIAIPTLGEIPTELEWIGMVTVTVGISLALGSRARVIGSEA